MPGLILGASALMSVGGVQADTLKKIKETGLVTMGVSASSGALSYALGNGKYGGFHIEICQKVLADIQKSLELKSLEIKYLAVTSENSISMVKNGTVDIECGSTTNNATRQKDVNFAVTTYVEEVRIAVRSDSGIQSIKDLSGKNVATTTDTSSMQLLRQHEHAAGLEFKEIHGQDHTQSFLLLELGRADAFVMDSQVLASNISKSKKPKGFKIVGEVLSVEPIAIMMSKDDPTFKLMVDGSIKAQIKTGDLAKTYDKWFMQAIPPTKIKVGLPASEATKAAWVQPNDRPVEVYGKN
jgi:glutamate/aspartate transport system substrate-binding protein